MNFKQLLKKYNSKWDIEYVKYVNFRNNIAEITNITDNNYELILNELAILYNTEPQQLKQLKINEIDEVLKKLLTIAEKPSKLQNRFKINGVEYGLIPDFNNISTAELIDLDTNLKNNNIPKLMSILYRPILKKQFNPFGILGQTRYTIIPHNKDNSKAFKNVNLEIVDGALTFFLVGCQTLN